MGILGPRGYYRYIADNGQTFVVFMRAINAVAGGATTTGRFSFPGLPRTVKPRFVVIQSVSSGEKRRIIITATANPRWNIGLWIYTIDGQTWTVVEFKSESRTHA